MNQEQSTRWIATLSLAVSTTALAAALASGCREAPESSPSPARASEQSAAAPAETPAAPAGEVSKAPEKPGGSAAAVPTEGKGDVTAKADEATSPTGATDAALNVKRLVVTRGIEEREPLPTESLQAGAPVFAFLELENDGDAEGAVVITFEREDERLGHVELSVPADTQRWRTWGKTALIRNSGTWTAVVRTKDGRELARQTFDVEKA